MGVPTTGSLSMLGLAQEALNGTYGTGTINGAISMYDLMNSGNAGSGETYPALNTSCNPNPSDCAGTATYAAIDSATNPAGNSIDVYYRSDVYSSQSIFVNTIGAVAYSSNTGSTRHPAGIEYNFNYTICANDVNLNSSGQITSTTPIC